MEISRRFFLGGTLAVAASTGFKGTLKALEAAPVLWGDGVHDDAPALQAFLDGRTFRTRDGFAGAVTKGEIRGGRFLLRSPLNWQHLTEDRQLGPCQWVNENQEDTICDGWRIPSVKEI